jgi:ABC-type polysaccharide/polyol phosphate transport system ATPase subunit
MLLCALKGKKTLIIVAHRLKTVESCDFLVWLGVGKIRMVDVPENVLSEYEESLR